LLSINNIEITNTTCPYVKKIHSLVASKSKEGFAIIVFGDENHSEVKGIISRISGPYIATLFKNKKFLTSFCKAHNQLFAVAQTTAKPEVFETLIATVRESLNPSQKFEFNNTICDATYLRQIAAAELSETVDLMVVIGGKNSSNTSKLYSIVSEIRPESIWVESFKDFTEKEIALITQKDLVGVTAGASTPENQIDELVAFLKKL